MRAAPAGLTGEQQDKLKAWISETLPRTTREIGAWIERECGIAYQVNWTPEKRPGA